MPFVPTELTYAEVIIAMVGLFIAGYFAKKKQAAKKYKAQLEKGKSPPSSLGV